MNKEAVLHHAASDCANCGADVSGNFCHQCGQEAVLHPPSAREFMHEFIGHYVALEGKLWKSMGLLLFRPGRLTLEYIKGRRVRYVQPLRMYLTFSLIFFAVLKFSMHDVALHLGDGDQEQAEATDTREHKEAVAPRSGAPSGAAGKHGGATEAAPPGAVHTNKTDMVLKEDHPGELGDGARRASTWMAPLSAHFARKFDHFGDLPFEEEMALLMESFYHYAPYAIFFMMPVFALYLKVLYLGSGRRYGEHLLFALHTNGFAFLAMALMILAPGGVWLRPLLFLWLTLYLPTAMRRVYGGSRRLTALRWMALMFLHQITIALAMVGAVMFGVLH